MLAHGFSIDMMVELVRAGLFARGRDISASGQGERRGHGRRAPS